MKRLDFLDMAFPDKAVSHLVRREYREGAASQCLIFGVFPLQ
jgi:hypothetical protein